MYLCVVAQSKNALRTLPNEASRVWLRAGWWDGRVTVSYEVEDTTTLSHFLAHHRMSLRMFSDVYQWEENNTER